MFVCDFQISPENDPANNWTLIRPHGPMASISEEESDSMYTSSLKTSHSSSVKNIAEAEADFDGLSCTCRPSSSPQPPNLNNPSSAPSIADEQFESANAFGSCDSEADGGGVASGSRAPPPPSRLLRIASYPKCLHDPHRFSLPGMNEFSPAQFSQKRRVYAVNFRQKRRGQQASSHLQQLPAVPPAPAEEFWTTSGNGNASLKPKPHPLRHGNTYPLFNLNGVGGGGEGVASSGKGGVANLDIPPCVRSILMHQLEAPVIRPPSKKEVRKLSKHIVLPDDPASPEAFTLQNDQYLLCQRSAKRSRRWCKSRPVVKIVGTFSILMTAGIVVTVLYFICKLVELNQVTQM